jgi:DNA gyrase subunit A
VVGELMGDETDDIMLITSGGVLVRTRANEISVIGRNTQGVKVIRMDDGEKVVSVDRIDGLQDSDEDTENGENIDVDTPENNTTTDADEADNSENTDDDNN